MTLPLRFWVKVRKTRGCWIWTGSCDQKGYGLYWHEGALRRAHRVSYVEHIGDIPDEVDHRCLNKACVRPDHLRPVTNKQNGEHRAGANRSSKSGIRGVFLDRGRWRAQVRHNGKLHDAGRHDTAADAEVAAVALRNSLFTHNTTERGESS